jgi:hypothetical protein
MVNASGMDGTIIAKGECDKCGEMSKNMEPKTVRAHSAKSI